MTNDDWFSTEEQYRLLRGHISQQKLKVMLGLRLAESLHEIRERAMREMVEVKNRIRAAWDPINEQIRSLDALAAKKGFSQPPSYYDSLVEDFARFDFGDRIHPDAQKLFIEDTNGLRSTFFSTRTCEAFVVAVDLRRSTDLMLKARAPDLFAAFITDLSTRLRQIVVEHHGVFDKFTGDGILAFFPDFYTGPDGFHALTAADDAHRAFADLYEKARSYFHTVLSPREVGLGIGIDHGTINLVVVGGAPTIVGVPVVYACRMAGGSAGTTLVNQPAYEKLASNTACTFERRPIMIKHEGECLAYSVRMSGEAYAPQQPAWMTAKHT